MAYWSYFPLLFLLMNCSSSSRLDETEVYLSAEKSESIPLVYSTEYRVHLLGLERLHPFDIHKYQKIYSQLEKDGEVRAEQVHVPAPLTKEQVRLVHSEDFWKSLSSSSAVATYLEAPAAKFLPNKLLKKGVIHPVLSASGGTYLAGRLALEKGAAINLGGGYHHAKPDRGEGFCLIADVPIAIRLLQRGGKIQRALIIDTDVHQGNGTIVCLANDPTTYTFSLHQKGIYPQPREVGDEDVELSAGMGDDEVLQVLKDRLDGMFERAKPDIVFHISGCDTLAGDPLAHMRMSEAGIVARDELIYDFCRSKNVPYVMTLAGGYSPRAWHAQYSSIKRLMSKARKQAE